MLANITAFGVLTRLRLDESADARRKGEKEIVPEGRARTGVQGHAVRRSRVPGVFAPGATS
jgi:hypothetical protein